MAAIRNAFIFVSLLVQTAVSNEPHSNENRRRLLDCNVPQGFYLAATLDVQTYYPAYCSASAITEIGAFLYSHFDAYSAYDTTVGAIEVVPTTQTAKTCTSSVRRNLLKTSDDIDDEEADPSMHRDLSLQGFIFKLATKCKMCPPDNSDGRRLNSDTSPITIRVRTDAFPSEFYYRVRIPNWLGNAGTTIYTSSGIINPFSEYVQTIYLAPNSKYFMNLKDIYGDGICCRYGSGSVQISAGTNMNGRTLYYNSGNFGSADTTSFYTPPAPTNVVSSSSLIDIGQLQLKYSEYLTYYLQATYHYDMTKCLYGTIPSVNVILKETTYTDAMASC